MLDQAEFWGWGPWNSNTHRTCHLHYHFRYDRRKGLFINRAIVFGLSRSLRNDSKRLRFKTNVCYHFTSHANRLRAKRNQTKPNNDSPNNIFMNPHAEGAFLSLVSGSVWSQCPS